MKKRYLFLVVSCFFTVACNNKVYKTNISSDETSRVYYLPKGEIHLKVERKQDDSPIEVEITPNLIADTRQPLYLHRDHSILYDDKYVVETDKNSLLQTINTATDFKGDEITTKFGELIGASTAILTNTSSFLRKPASVDEQEQLCSTKQFKTEIYINPYEDASWQVNQAFPHDRCIKVEYTLLQDVTSQIQPTESILYRRLTNFPVKVKFEDKKQGVFIEKNLVVGLPDLNTVEHFSVERSHFVDRDTKLTFVNGILTKDESTYPSEALGFISLPLQLVNGVSKAITGRFDFKTKELNNEAGYLNAKKLRDDALNGNK